MFPALSYARNLIGWFLRLHHFIFIGHNRCLQFWFHSDVHFKPFQHSFQNKYFFLVFFQNIEIKWLMSLVLLHSNWVAFFFRYGNRDAEMFAWRKKCFQASENWIKIGSRNKKKGIKRMTKDLKWNFLNWIFISFHLYSKAVWFISVTINV